MVICSQIVLISVLHHLLNSTLALAHSGLFFSIFLYFSRFNSILLHSAAAAIFFVWLVKHEKIITRTNIAHKRNEKISHWHRNRAFQSYCHHNRFFLHISFGVRRFVQSRCCQTLFAIILTEEKWRLTEISLKINCMICYASPNHIFQLSIGNGNCINNNVRKQIEWHFNIAQYQLMRSKMYSNELSASEFSHL